MPWSLPSRGRGLKFFLFWQKQRYCLSLPSRGRGLKSHYNGFVAVEIIVAPLAGAWIEIKLRLPNFFDTEVAPLAGRGLK